VSRASPQGPEPIHLAIISGQLGLGGSEQQLYYLLAGLDRRRFEPLVINLGGRPVEYWEERITALGVPVWSISRTFGRVGRLARIARRLSSAGVAIVHGWGFHTNPYAAVAGRLGNVPVRIGSIRESVALTPKYNLLQWAGGRGLDVLITNSRAAADEVRRSGQTNADLHVVPNCIEVADIASPGERSQLKAELGFASNDRIIGTIGRMDSNKNHSMLVKAFATVASQWPELHLLIIGDGPLMSQVVSEASALGVGDRVHCPGAKPRAARFLTALDVCCLTSQTEGMPNLLMEASAAALPVVSTRCGGTSEVIDHGVTGFLVATGDSSQFAAQLSMLLSDPELSRKMGEAGRVRMCGEFRVETMVTRTMGVYEEALRRRAAVSQ
jgi:glycosyltransferase involved in cell wall biosynthesis